MKIKDVKVEAGVKKRLQVAEIISLIETGKIKVNEEVLNKVENRYNELIIRKIHYIGNFIHEEHVSNEYKQYKKIMGKERKILKQYEFAKVVQSILYNIVDDVEMIPGVDCETGDGINRFILREIEQLNIRKREANKELEERQMQGKNGKVDFELRYKIDTAERYKQALIELRNKYIEI